MHFAHFYYRGKLTGLIHQFETDARHALCIQTKKKGSKMEVCGATPVRRVTTFFQLGHLKDRQVPS